jgi:hypothetical protein
VSSSSTTPPRSCYRRSSEFVPNSPPGDLRPLYLAWLAAYGT